MASAEGATVSVDLAKKVQPQQGEAHYTRWEFSPEGIAHRSRQFINTYSPFLPLITDHKAKIISHLSKAATSTDDPTQTEVIQPTTETLVETDEEKLAKESALSDTLPTSAQERTEPETNQLKKEKVLSTIRNRLSEIRAQGLTREQLASKENLPEVLGLLSAAAEISLNQTVRPVQLLATIALVTGNKKLHQSPLRALQEIFSLASSDGREDPEGKGNIVPLRTGEGKTLVAALTAITFTLLGEDKGIFIGTSNDILAAQNINEIAPLYHALGIEVSLIDSQHHNVQYTLDMNAQDSHGYPLRQIELRQQAYSHHVVYGTFDEIGFDYEKDTRTPTPDVLLQSKGLYALVWDELEEEAMDPSPLILEVPFSKDTGEEDGVDVEKIVEEPVIIDNKPYTPTELHLLFKNLVALLDENDLTINATRKSIELFDPTSPHTKRGKKEKIEPRETTVIDDNSPKLVENWLRTAGILEENETLRDSSKFTPNQRIHLYNAYGRVGIDRMNELMKAFGLLSENHDFYRHKDTQILLYYLRPALQSAGEFLRLGGEFGLPGDDKSPVLLDATSGKAQEGRQLIAGGHAGLEAFYNLPISPETRIIADMIRPEFAAKFEILAGLSATAPVFAEEFSRAYHLDVIDIPPFFESQREDEENDIIYLTQKEKFEAIFEREILPLYSGNQDVQQPVLIALHTATSVHEFHKFLLDKLRDYNQTHPDTLIAPQKIQFVTWDNRNEAPEKFARMGQEGYITITDMAGRGIDSHLGGRKPRSEDFERLVDFETALRVWESSQIEALEIKRILDSVTLGGVRPQQILFTSEEAYNEEYNKWKIQHDRVNRAGGLRVVYEPYRLDQQVKGRTARNGDKGATIPYSSLDDQLYIDALGDGRQKRYIDRIEKHDGLPITGSEARELVQGSQRNLYIKGEQARKQLAESYYPLRKVTQEYEDRRKQLLMLGSRETTDSVVTGSPIVQVQESALTQQIMQMIDDEVTDIASKYGTELDKRLMTSKDEEIPQVLTTTLEEFYRLTHLDEPTKELITRRIAAYHYLREGFTGSFARYIPSLRLQEILIDVAHTRYMHLIIDDFGEAFKAKTLPQYIAERDRINELFAQLGQPPVNMTDEHIIQRELREHQRAILLETMDRQWQLWRERQLDRNRHLLFIAKDEKDALAAIKPDVEKNIAKFETTIRRKILMGLYSRLGNLS